MKTPIRVVSIIALALLLSGAIVKWLMLPNQLLLVSAALLLYLLVILPSMAWFNLKNSKGFFPKLIDIITPILVLVAMVAIYMGILQQGLPNLVLVVMLIFIVVYFLMKIRAATASKHQHILYGSNVGLAIVLVVVNAPFQQVVPDDGYRPDIKHPAFQKRLLSTVHVDEGHNNYHTLEGQYRTFGNILEMDGYHVQGFKEEFTSETLKDIRILVISNAIKQKNKNDWSTPTYSAFTETEIETLNTWVKNGGSLFLIADHIPFAGAAKDLAQSFGFEFNNGHAGKPSDSEDYFYRSNGTIHSNVITNGKDGSLKVDSIRTFSGQAFSIPDSATPILTFGEGYVQWKPNRAWDLQSASPKPIEGLSQGAFMGYGKGRIVVFGEAAMFTGQLGAGLSWVKIGLNSPTAKNNYKLLLNIIRWLEG